MTGRKKISNLTNLATSIWVPNTIERSLQTHLKQVFHHVQLIYSHLQVLPRFFSSSASVWLNSLLFFSVMKQYRHSPFTLWGRLTTAASATAACTIRAASTSAVLIRWPERQRASYLSAGRCSQSRYSSTAAVGTPKSTVPEMFSMSSILPVIQ